MSSLPSIIGLLVMAQRSLSRKGHVEAASALDKPLSELLEANAHSPSFLTVASLEGDQPVIDVYDVGDNSAVSLAVGQPLPRRPLRPNGSNSVAS